MQNINPQNTDIFNKLQGKYKIPFAMTKTNNIINSFFSPYLIRKEILIQKGKSTIP